MPGPDEPTVEELSEIALDVDQAAINAYARITDDFNPIHTDPAFAATTPMGGVIAHGTMSLNLIWQMAAQNFRGDFERIGMKIRFVAPVRPGDRVAAGGRRTADGSGRYEVWVRNQRGENVIAGTMTLRGHADTTAPGVT